MSWLARQSFLGPESEFVLRDSHALIAGLGGGGSHVAQQLAHIGVGHFDLCDPGRYEEKNHNRTVGGTHADIRAQSPKVEIAVRMIRAINPKARINVIDDIWQNALPSVRGCDALFGCVDGYTQRDQLETLCRRFLVPYIDIGMDVNDAECGYVLHGQVILSLPGSLCMRCFNFLRPDLLANEAQGYGHAGARPQVIWPNGVLASTAVGLFTQLILPWHNDVPASSLILDYDGNRHTTTLSPRVAALSGVVCPHFGGLDDTGDPFWASPSCRNKAKTI